MRSLRLIHRWLGLVLALPLIIQGLSGAVLALEPVFPVWSRGSHTGAAAPANQILAAARAASPAGLHPARYVPPEAAGAPTVVYLAPAGRSRGAGLVLRLDPVTATPLGPPKPETGVIAWLRRLHTNWLMPQWGGRQLGGWFGIGLLTLAILGIPLWWPTGAWREGFTVPRGARGLILQRRLHGAAAAWLWVMLIVTGATGVIEAFPQTTRAALGIRGGGRPRGERAAPGAPLPTPDLDRAVALAAAAAPGTALRFAVLPASSREPFRLFLGPPGTEGVRLASTVTVDAAATRVLSVAGAASAPAGESVLRWAHDLHFGQGFGPIWRALTVAVGLSLPLFGVTGLAMWLLRQRNRRRVDAVRRAALQSGD